jgi:hypothetical protein
MLQRSELRSRDRASHSFRRSSTLAIVFTSWFSARAMQFDCKFAIVEAGAAKAGAAIQRPGVRSGVRATRQLAPSASAPLHDVALTGAVLCVPLSVTRTERTSASERIELEATRRQTSSTAHAQHADTLW